MTGETLTDIEASSHFDTALDNGEWYGNEWTDTGENDSVSEEFEQKIVRLQAALDEMTDTLASELRTAVLLIGSGETLKAIGLLESIITASETFSSIPAEDEEEE